MRANEDGIGSGAVIVLDRYGESWDAACVGMSRREAWFHGWQAGAARVGVTAQTAGVRGAFLDGIEAYERGEGLMANPYPATGV